MMSDVDLESRLTAAARDALSELADDYRERILLRANAHAAQLTGEVREISVRDILEAANDSVEISVTRRNASFGRIAQLYQVVGIVMAASGVFLFLVPRIAMEGLEIVEILPMAVSAAGVLVAALGIVLSRRFERHSAAYSSSYIPSGSDQTEIVGFFLLRWNEIELLLRTIVASEFGESTAGGPLTIQLQKLRESGHLDDAIAVQLRELVAIRNQIVHNTRQLPPSELRRAVSQAEFILIELRERRRIA